MLSPNFHQKLKKYVRVLQSFADRVWYPPLIGFLAAVDNFIVIIPNDGILVSSSMLTPKRWIILAQCVAIGSTLGAVGLAMLIEYQGLPWILELYPGIDQSNTWRITDDFFKTYGPIIIFTVAISPLLQQPVVILASLADTPLMLLALFIFFGRTIKFLIMAYVGAHAPRYLGRLWGLKSELEDAGIQIEKK